MSVEKRTGKVDVGGEDGETVVGGDIGALHLHAQFFIGVRGLGTIRAGRAVLAAGYEPEARSHARVLVELQAHRQAILDDDTGTEALAWLQRKRLWGIGKRVSKIGPKELYRNLSSDSHGDPLPVERLFDPLADALMVSPRHTAGTRATLWLYAGFARDQAVLTAGLAGMTLGGVDQLDAELKAIHDNLDDDATA
jgi:hypothetical protein